MQSETNQICTGCLGNEVSLAYLQATRSVPIFFYKKFAIVLSVDLTSEPLLRYSSS